LIVGIDTINVVIRKGGRISNGIPENMKGVSIIPVQPVIGAKPHKSIVVFVNTSHRIV
jgi:hypothetical protein